jgi:hypothetical protein
MSQAHNRSLSIALGRLRFAVVTSCWVIALSLGAQVTVWSLCTFTDMRQADAAPPDGVPAIVNGNDKPAQAAKAEKSRSARDKDARWRPESEQDKEPEPLSANERVFKIALTVSRTMAMVGALLVCPLMALGVIIAVPVGAPKAERAVNALIWALVLSALVLPLGGWFGIAWREGAASSYEQMAAAVDTISAEEQASFSPKFYGRYLVLPGACALGFIIAGFQFSSAVVAVLLRRQVFDPELEEEASNVAATSLHGTGRTAGALTKALQEDKSKAKKKKAAGPMTKLSPGEAPKRLI